MMEQASGTISLTLVTGTGRCPLALPASDERLDEVRSFLGVEDFAEAVIGDIHFSLPHLADIIPLDTITAEDANALALCLQVRQAGPPSYRCGRRDHRYHRRLYGFCRAR